VPASSCPEEFSFTVPLGPDAAAREPAEDQQGRASRKGQARHHVGKLVREPDRSMLTVADPVHVPVVRLEGERQAQRDQTDHSKQAVGPGPAHQPDGATRRRSSGRRPGGRPSSRSTAAPPSACGGSGHHRDRRHLRPPQRWHGLPHPGAGNRDSGPRRGTRHRHQPERRHEQRHRYRRRVHRRLLPADPEQAARQPLLRHGRRRRPPDHLEHDGDGRTRRRVGLLRKRQPPPRSTRW
jgi:hypothetical protein